MITRIVVITVAASLLVVVLIGAAAGAATGILANPPQSTATSSPSQGATQLDSAQYCALGKVTPGRETGYGSFDADQIANATTIYQVSQQLGLPPYAAVIAIATAMQESSLQNLDYGDRDSLGLFQQRPSQGWGTPEEIMNPAYAATKFYDALVKVPDWQTIPLTQAAQAVQESAYPGAYAQWQGPAEYLVSSISGALDNCPANS